jgi:hypothetical protein
LPKSYPASSERRVIDVRVGKLEMLIGQVLYAERNKAVALRQTVAQHCIHYKEIIVAVFKASIGPLEAAVLIVEGAFKARSQAGFSERPEQLLVPYWIDLLQGAGLSHFIFYVSG